MIKDLTGFCLDKLDKHIIQKIPLNNKYSVPFKYYKLPQSNRSSLILEVGMDKKGK